MTDSAIAAALARGALVVTPNKRLARDCVLRHDLAQRAAGRLAWVGARALPWHAFVGELWQQALDAEARLPAHRLDAAQSAHLWRVIVAEDLTPDPLLDAAASAALAADAWALAHAYGEGRHWLAMRGGPEVEAFVRWGKAFERATARLDALDPARAPDALAGHLRALPRVAALDVVLAGFVELAPQQERLLAALREAGAHVARSDAPPGAATRACLYAAPSPRDELAGALAWARAHAQADPQASVGIVVHDLHERRPLVEALAEDVLCPGLAWPGRERALRPYDISLGAPLAEVPVIACALELLALGDGPLARARAETLVRSRYLPQAAAMRAVRASIARGWLEQGRASLSLAMIAASLARVDADLARRWRLAERMRPAARATPREFAEAWRAWLDALGWCDESGLDGVESAARGAWSELLAEFVRLTAVAGRMTRAHALRTLVEAARAQAFAPESPGARIRILGSLEAAGLAFDALWVAGWSAEAWPRAPQPNPLLPIDWQRSHGVARSSPARELAYAAALTAAFAASAGEVVFSYAQTIDDHRSLPSPLIAHLPPLAQPLPRHAPTAWTAFARRAALERVDDARAPGWPAGAPLRGGAALIEAQSDCPFQAVARFRLDAEVWPDAFAGLRPTERGKLVHAALAAFWREVRDHATLVGLSAAALARHLAAAVAAGRAAVADAKWDALPPIVAAVELGHATRVIGQWLRDHEWPRPPFTVEAMETKVEVELDGHTLALRIDRLDRLPGGRRAIIDYKTGRAVEPARWFAARPQGPQLALYALALAGGDPIAALAYAQLKPGRVGVVGLAEDAALWPALPRPSGLRGVTIADWSDAQRQLHDSVRRLAHEVHRGEAAIAPRAAKVCTQCARQALCRFVPYGEADEMAEADGA